MKNRGFTDRLYLLNFISVWMFVYIGIILTVFSATLCISDLSVFNVGIPCAFTEIGVHTGFVIRKAKAENIRKFGNPHIEEESEVSNGMVNG